MASFSNFATHGGKRALLRSVLYGTAAALGGARRYRDIEWSKVQRLVFLCKGNICRSPFAAAVARQRGLPAISAGVNAAKGSPAAPGAVVEADKFGVDLSLHRATSILDLDLTADDLLIGFEPFHIDQLRSSGRSASGYQVTLLGVWLRPANLYIHDPYGANAKYFHTCFRRIDRAVEVLRARVHIHTLSGDG